MSEASHGRAPEADRAEEPEGIVDWVGTGRRIRRSGMTIAVLVPTAWIVSGLLGEGVRLGALGGWVGLGLGVMVLVELLVVSAAVLRAERRAAVRGERLGSPDVGLIPPRLRGFTSSHGHEPDAEPDSDASDPWGEA